MEIESESKIFDISGCGNTKGKRDHWKHTSLSNGWKQWSDLFRAEWNPLCYIQGSDMVWRKTIQGFGCWQRHFRAALRHTCWSRDICCSIIMIFDTDYARQHQVSCLFLDTASVCFVFSESLHWWCKSRHQKHGKDSESGTPCRFFSPDASESALPYIYADTQAAYSGSFLPGLLAWSWSLL